MNTPAQPGAAGGYVPPRCRRSVNASFDRAFALHVCNQRDSRCIYHGPVYILDEDGRRYECRLRDLELAEPRPESETAPDAESPPTAHPARR